MIRIFFIVLISCLFFTTCLVGVKKPDMHKTVFIYDSALVFDIQPKEDIIPIKNEVVSQKVVVKETKTIPVKTAYETKKNISNIPKNKVQEKQIQPVKVVQKAEVQLEPEVKVQETQNELIQWNVWRSRLQNQIMEDVKLPEIPDGIVFKFSFDVDKFGKISNITTYSTTPVYTPYAIQYIAPVIRSYQGKSILNFPSGSSRYQTRVEGGWRISRVKKLSTPNDFYDLENVRK